MKTTLGLFVAVGVLVLQCVAATEAPNDVSVCA